MQYGFPAGHCFFDFSQLSSSSTGSGSSRLGVSPSFSGILTSFGSGALKSFGAGIFQSKALKIL
jgi:hypothetical protein